MDLNDERVNMIAHTVGRAVLELALTGNEITQQSIVDKLELYRKETKNTIGKGLNRDAAKLIRDGIAGP